MLVLSRKKNESIVIGEGKDQVIVTVVQVKGKTVRLGIEAGKHVPVVRSELGPIIEPARDSAESDDRCEACPVCGDPNKISINQGEAQCLSCWENEQSARGITK